MAQCRRFVVDNMKDARRQCRREALKGNVFCKRHKNQASQRRLNIGEERLLTRRIRRRWP
jgi:hypothetical protein